MNEWINNRKLYIGNHNSYLTVYNPYLTVSCLFVLVGSDCDEFRFLKDISSESAVRQLQDVIGTHEVKTRLVLLHRVQNRL